MSYGTLKSLRLNPIKGPNPLKWAVPVTYLDGSPHNPDCSSAPLFTTSTVNLTLDDALDSMKCSCFDYTEFEPQDAAYFIPSRIEGALKELKQLPNSDEMKINDPDSAEEFYDSLRPFFIDFCGEDGDLISPTVMQWMHFNKGYPLNPEEIRDFYEQSIEKMSDQLAEVSIKKALGTPNHRSHQIVNKLLELRETSPLLTFREIIAQEMTQSTRVVTFSTYRNPSQERGFKNVTQVIINHLCNQLSPGTGRLFALPPLLAAAAHAVSVASSEAVTVDYVPSKTELITAASLFGKGSDDFLLLQALESAHKLEA